MEIIRIIVQSVVSLVTLFLLAKLIGDQQISQLSMFDYINSISIGSIAAELATNLEEWYKPFTAMLVYGLITALINWCTCKSLTARKLVNGKPLILYENDQIKRCNLMKAKLSLNGFLTQCRLAGYFDLQQLAFVVLETNGQLSFLLKAQERPVTPKDLAQSPAPSGLFVSLVQDGKVLKENLQNFGKDETWLRAQLHAAGIGQLSEVFFACCDDNGSFRAYRIPRPGQTERSVFE